MSPSVKTFKYRLDRHLMPQQAEHVDRKKWRNFVATIVDVYGPTAKDTALLLSADETILLTEKTQSLQRWTEHLGGVLNRPSAVSDAVIPRLPQIEINVDFALFIHETIKSMQQLSSDEAAVAYAILAEIYMHDGPRLVDHLTKSFQAPKRSPAGFQGRHNRPPLQAERKPPNLR
nr:unnamed protein product [Spirometra erinaceieuropaei]